MRTVHAVIGETGEYSDRGEWIVRIFLDESRAQEFCVLLNEWARLNGVSYENEERPDYEILEELRCPLDPRMGKISYTGVRWFLDTVDLDEQEPPCAK